MNAWVSEKQKKSEIEIVLSEISIYFQDESSVEIDKDIWRVVIPKTKNGESKKAKIRWVEMLHNHRHIFWFLRQDGKVRYCIRKSKKTQDFKYSLMRLCEEDKTKYKIIILDNASIHRSKEIQKYCEKKNIILVYLTPYSPDLNDIEPMWKKFKRIFQLIQWQYWKSLEQKIRNVMNGLWNQKWLIKNILCSFI